MIPLRPLKTDDISNKWPREIIIHHTAELELTNGNLTMDKPTFQSYALQKNNYQINKTQDPPYHFLVDKINDDYEIIVNKPLFTKCVFEDIPRIFDRSIHIGLVGNYDNINIGSNRIYTVLAYRLLVPMMRLFQISENEIYTHSDVTDNNEISCPGEFFNMAKLKTIVRAQFRRTALTRR